MITIKTLEGQYEFLILLFEQYGKDECCITSKKGDALPNSTNAAQELPGAVQS
jgi:hypothetical protein